MLPVALQKKVNVITNDFIVHFKPFKKRLFFFRSCIFLYGLVTGLIAFSLILRTTISMFSILAILSLGILLVGFCLQSKLQSIKKIPLLLPISPEVFAKVRGYSETKLFHMLPVYNGYEFLHPATIELLNKIYTKQNTLQISKLLKEVKQQSEVAAFVSNFVPIQDTIPVAKIPEVLANAFVLAAYGQFSSIYPEHLVLSVIKTKSSYKFYLAALLSVFENTFRFNGKRYIITKPLLGGIKKILTSNSKIFNIKGPKFIGKSALVYLFTNFFYGKKFQCKPIFLEIKQKKELYRLPSFSIKPRVIFLDKTFKDIDFAKLLKFKNSLIFIEAGELPTNVKRYSTTVKLLTPDLYDLYKLAIFWDLNNLFKVHYRIDQLYKIVEKSQIKHLDVPQPIRLFRFLTGEFS